MKSWKNVRKYLRTGKWYILKKKVVYKPVYTIWSQFFLVKRLGLVGIYEFGLTPGVGDG